MHNTHWYISTEQGITMKNEIVDFLTPEICQILKHFAGIFSLFRFYFTAPLQKEPYNLIFTENISLLL